MLYSQYVGLGLGISVSRNQGAQLYRALRTSKYPNKIDMVESFEILFGHVRVQLSFHGG